MPLPDLLEERRTINITQYLSERYANDSPVDSLDELTRVATNEAGPGIFSLIHTDTQHPAAIDLSYIELDINSYNWGGLDEVNQLVSKLFSQPGLGRHQRIQLRQALAFLSEPHPDDPPFRVAHSNHLPNQVPAPLLAPKSLRPFELGADVLSRTKLRKIHPRVPFRQRRNAP